jgi:Domain of unknown function (DUF4157)
MLHAATRQTTVRSTIAHARPVRSPIPHLQHAFGNRAVRSILNSPGEALPPHTRSTMESALGRDFSRVRIHRGAEAIALSRSLDALAFTHRNHVYFGRGMYDPSASPGQRLLAHELTHVAQQGYAEPRPQPGGAAKTVHPSPPAIQRTATWTATKPNEVNNLANVAINGGSAGDTIVILNGTPLPMSDTVLADAPKAIAKPRLDVDRPAKGNVTVRVASAPSNTGSYDQRVLVKGPWHVNTTKEKVGQFVGSLPACAGSANTTFQAKGKPDDDTVQSLNIGHEGEHVKADKKAFEDSIGEWDKKLTAAAKAKTRFAAPTEPEATANLYVAMGGTPDAIADQFVQTVNDEGLAFHGTARGKTIKFSNPGSSPDCSTSWAEARNPYTP